jgi:hypothetical protein
MWEREYGLTWDGYQQMWWEQHEGCGICMVQEGRFHVDHDHKTGKVRGILCQHCNYGLGHFRDSVLFLEEAIKYLKSCEVGHGG